MPFFRNLFVLVCLAGLGLVCGGAEPDTVSQARAYVGPESALAAVRSLRFLGELEVVEGSATGPSSTARLEILFQKPDRQRITATQGTRVETTALDGYDAWQRISDTADATRWEVVVLGAEQIKRLRAHTFENLSFFHGLEARGGRVDDLGLATVNGVACHKMAFVHGLDVVFVRSFEVATGRVVLTETNSGTSVREEGELRSGGLRFPARIITVNRSPDGSTRTIRVTFSSVEVNPALDAALFAVPALTRTAP